VGKIVEKAVRRNVFLIIWHCILSAELRKTLLFGDFAHWEANHFLFLNWNPESII